jgi:ferrous iron transport protein A
MFHKRPFHNRMFHSRMFPLTLAGVGESVRLVQIRGGGMLTQRLTALGLTTGVEMTIVQDTGGALLISVRDTRIALGRGMAHKIMVVPLDGNLSQSYNEGEGG